ncbi:glycosyltransferase family 4 protein [Azospirillum sp.]|uniref:glycosyltransferase family 4 protein n=1 Tax=Azospirillum sp. TaxID=34012 RepID=UPI003D72AA80
MPSVLLLSRYDRLGASSRLRLLDFAAPLARAGITVTPAPLFDDDYLRDLYAGRRTPAWRIAAAYARRLRTLLGAGRFDLVWLEKEALPWLPGAAETRLLGRVPYVMDIDDAWYLRYAEHRAAPVRRLLGGKFDALARGSRMVIAGNGHLAAWARGAGAPEVRIVPTVIDLDRYPPPVAPPPHRPVTVGWMGTRSTAPYLEMVAEPLARLAGEARLQVIGADGVALPGVEVACAPWTEDGEVAGLSRFDIGIMPLADGPWERGKCGYKLIQYMAAGRPVVASPVGVNTEIVRHGETGFLASTADEWAAALAALAADPDLRARMGAAGRRVVEERYTTQAVLPALADALRSAAGRPPA